MTLNLQNVLLVNNIYAFEPKKRFNKCLRTAILGSQLIIIIEALSIFHVLNGKKTHCRNKVLSYIFMNSNDVMLHVAHL